MNEFRLETERLIIRNFKPTDLEDFHEYCKVPGVGELAGWSFHKSMEESQEILAKFIELPNQYALVYKENNKVIGSISLEKRERSSKVFDQMYPELGYVLAKQYWGQRLVYEAVEKLIDYAFNVEKINAIVVCHFSDNTQSKSVILRSGFKYVASFEEYCEPIKESKFLDYYILYNK